MNLCKWKLRQCSRSQMRPGSVGTHSVCGNPFSLLLCGLPGQEGVGVGVTTGFWSYDPSEGYR